MTLKNDFPDIEILRDENIFIIVRIADAEITFDWTGRVIRSDRPIELSEHPEKYGLVPGNEKLKKILDAFREKVENKQRIYDKINAKLRPA